MRPWSMEHTEGEVKTKAENSERAWHLIFSSTVTEILLCARMVKNWWDPETGTDLFKVTQLALSPSITQFPTTPKGNTQAKLTPTARLFCKLSPSLEGPPPLRHCWRPWVKSHLKTPPSYTALLPSLPPRNSCGPLGFLYHSFWNLNTAFWYWLALNARIWLAQLACKLLNSTKHTAWLLCVTFAPSTGPGCITQLSLKTVKIIECLPATGIFGIYKTSHLTVGLCLITITQPKSIPENGQPTVEPAPSCDTHVAAPHNSVSGACGRALGIANCSCTLEAKARMLHWSWGGNMYSMLLRSSPILSVQKKYHLLFLFLSFSK